ncbi:hypothetical protein J6590_022644 [Homalodisca vitripennis]|nr:hypothetical protein J6590_022644 [Homalodisca vitripennis]
MELAAAALTHYMVVSNTTDTSIVQDLCRDGVSRSSSDSLHGSVKYYRYEIHVAVELLAATALTHYMVVGNTTDTSIVQDPCCGGVASSNSSDSLHGSVRILQIRVSCRIHVAMELLAATALTHYMVVGNTTDGCGCGGLGVCAAALTHYMVVVVEYRAGSMSRWS